MNKNTNNAHEDYTALRDKFVNDLRFIFPTSKLVVSVDLSEINKNDFFDFFDTAPKEISKLRKRKILGTFDCDVLELDNGDELSTAL